MKEDFDNGAITFYGPKEKHGRIMDYYKIKHGISFNKVLCDYIETYFTTNKKEIEELERTLTEMFLDKK